MDTRNSQKLRKTKWITNRADQFIYTFATVVVLLVYGFEATAGAQVTIHGNLPVNSGKYTLPATVSASASSPRGISGWQVYFGNTSYFSSSTGLNGILDENLSNVPPGTYQVTITAWDNGGNHSSYVVSNVTVISSPLPTPPQNATAYPNLQNKNEGYNNTTWQPCIGSCSGSNGPGSSSLSYPVSSPSLSGASLGENSDSSGDYYNTMYYWHLGCPNNNCSAVGNMLDDVWFQVKSGDSIQQLEFDPDLFDDSGRWEYFGSVACQMNGGTSGTWYVWDMASQQKSGKGWTSTSIPCTITQGAWHHLQLYVTVNTSGSGCPNSAPCYTYKTLVFDGSTVFENLNWSYNAGTGSYGHTVNVQQQIDNFKASPANNTVYYDNYELWVW
ncbi:MAG TPA: hypothetical protein VH350_10820 [Candidatus Sulfotelmatobacter sp.]|nr:hypothetical protein [Candidatus Sulfotelmatobacter sp.]